MATVKVTNTNSSSSANGSLGWAIAQLNAGLYDTIEIDSTLQGRSFSPNEATFTKKAILVGEATLLGGYVTMGADLTFRKFTLQSSPVSAADGTKLTLENSKIRIVAPDSFGDIEASAVTGSGKLGLELDADSSISTENAWNSYGIKNVGNETKKQLSLTFERVLAGSIAVDGETVCGIYLEDSNTTEPVLLNMKKGFSGSITATGTGNYKLYGIRGIHLEGNSASFEVGGDFSGKVETIGNSGSYSDDYYGILLRSKNTSSFHISGNYSGSVKVASGTAGVGVYADSWTSGSKASFAVDGNFSGSMAVDFDTFSGALVVSATSSASAAGAASAEVKIGKNFSGTLSAGGASMSGGYARGILVHSYGKEAVSSSVLSVGGDFSGSVSVIRAGQGSGIELYSAGKASASIGGALKANISVSGSTYAVGIRITAEQNAMLQIDGGISATISASTTGESAYGIYVYSENDKGLIGGKNDSALTISGTILVSGDTEHFYGKTAGIAGNVDKVITISGTIAAGDYSSARQDVLLTELANVRKNNTQWSRSKDSTGLAIYDSYSGNDTITLDKGALIFGDIDLGYGKNSLTIDTGAKVYGDITARSMDVTFRVTSAGRDAVIMTSGSSSFDSSMTTIGFDFSKAQSGTYVLISGNVGGLSGRTFTWKYGTSGGTMKIGDNISFGGGTATLSSTGSALTLVVTGGAGPGPGPDPDPDGPGTKPGEPEVVDPSERPIPNPSPVPRPGPALVLPSGADVKKYNVTLKWSKGVASGNDNKVARYEIAWDGREQSVKSTSLTLKNLSIGTHSYKVRGIDRFGNIGDWSDAATFTVRDVTAPKMGKVSWTIEGYAATLAWSAQDNVGVAYYEVTVDGETFRAESGVTIDNLAVGKHKVEVRAFDAEGNAAKAAKTTITVKDVTAPGAVTDLAPAEADGKYRATLEWAPAVDNSGKIARYEIRLDNGRIYKSSRTSLTVGKLSVGEHSYTVRAIDKAGNVGDWSSDQSITVRDVTPPATVSVKAKVDGNTLILDWKTPKDNVGVVGYCLRYGADLEHVKEFSADQLSYAIEDLASGKYRYELSAFDAAGNYSKPRIGTAIVKFDLPPDAIPSLSMPLADAVSSAAAIDYLTRFEERCAGQLAMA